MKLRYRIRSHFETWLTRLAFLTIPYLPRKAVVCLAGLLGRAAYSFSRKLYRIGRVNLDIAYGSEMDQAGKNLILLKSYKSFALVLMDTFWFSKFTAKRIVRHVSFEPCFNPLFKDCPHVSASAHYGNWEILGLGVTSKGFPLHSVAKPLKNARVDELFDRVRHKTGQKIVKHQGAVRTLLRILMQGGKIGLIMDQNIRLSEGGQFFPLFGLPATFTTAAAALAVKTKTDVIVCSMRPLPDGNYTGDYCKEIAIAPYLKMNTAEATTALTGEIVSEMEKFIRIHPENWLWSYKRWKYIPDGDNPEQYPFYSRRAV